jgi:LysM repeat protein
MWIKQSLRLIAGVWALCWWAAWPAAAAPSVAAISSNCTSVTISGSSTAASVTVTVNNATTGLPAATVAFTVIGGNYGGTFSLPSPVPNGTPLTGAAVDSTGTTNLGTFTCGAPSDGRLNNDFAPMALYCNASGGVTALFIQNGSGTAGFVASSVDIANGLAQARNSGRNVQVASGTGGIGLWVLTSGELQATRRFAGQLDYDFIFPISRCGVIVPTSALTPSTPSVPVPSVGGMPAPSVGTTTTVTTVTTTTTTTVITGGPCVVRDGARVAVVVVRGDTLFRIARRYNTTSAVVAAFNGISNPNRIFVGQCVQIP